MQTENHCKYFDSVKCDLGLMAPFCVMTCPMNVEIEERERAKMLNATKPVNEELKKGA